jgi:Rrf2 family protein
MNFTAKSRYALKILMDLSIMESSGQQTRIEVSTRHGIPLDFMDQILARLKAADLIQTTRGRSGGMTLSKSPKDISLWTIFSAVEDNLYPVQCLENVGCIYDSDCVSKAIWADVFSGIESQLKSQTLERYVKQVPQISNFMHTNTVHECKAPKRLPDQLTSIRKDD